MPILVYVVVVALAAVVESSEHVRFCRDSLVPNGMMDCTRGLRERKAPQDCLQLMKHTQ